MALIPMIFFLKEDEQLFIQSLTSRRVVNGPGRVIISPLEKATHRKAVPLSPTEYLVVRNTLTGELRNEVGPQLFFLTANDIIIERKNAIVLENDEYIRLVDQRTGVVRVEVGEKALIPGPYDEVEDVKQGVNVDEHHAVLVRNTDTGQFTLVTEQQVFVPAANQEIAEVRRRIILEDHETVVIKDKDGKFIFRKGTDAERSFFLEPYQELVLFRWSSGVTKEKRELKLTHIDFRPKYMWYDFEVRTQDNVELQIGITFFWQILEVGRMIGTTDDATGDVCAHARSRIVQSVSRTTLEKFLAEFNAIVGKSVLDGDDTFYAQRGVRVLSVEVRYIVCKDPGTQRILQEIIQETTNRLNRLQKQESENEIKLRQVQGDIETEQQSQRLLTIRRENAGLAAVTEGEAEAEKLLSFFNGLGDTLTLQDKIALFNVLRKSEVLTALSKGTAQLYFTPADVDLSIDTRGNW